MTNIKCPACAGPDNAGCATCNGTSKVTKKTHDDFSKKAKRQKDELQARLALSNFPFEKNENKEQSIVFTVAQETITATAEDSTMIWDSESGQWVMV
jgi:hypothetical protein